MSNKFLSAVNNIGRTENGALTNLSTGSAIVDQFGTAGSYRDRPIEEVFNDQAKIFEENELMALIFPFYLRTITRKPKGINGTFKDIAKGQGARDEAFKRLLWFAKYHPNTFNENIALLPVVGSWKDLIQIAFYDQKFGINAVDINVILKIFVHGLNNTLHEDLVKKYLPRIVSNKKCTTEWTKFRNDFAKKLAKYIGCDARELNHFKSSGEAHTFQQLISQKKFNEIDWNTIPGKALLLLGTGKFLQNNNLADSFQQWMENRTDIKFNGYPYELALKVDNANPITKSLIDLQFKNLIETGHNCGSIEGNVLCALDTSGSMLAYVGNSKITAYDVCVSLGIYFSELNKGAFHNNVVMFDSTSYTKELSGTFTDKWKQIEKEKTAWGSTNFQSIIDLLCTVRRASNIPLEDYPTTLLVVSDMEFNPSEYYNRENTNYNVAKDKLYDVFPKEYVNNLKFVWWNVCSRNKNMPATLDDPNNYFFSGFDGAIITELLGGTSKENKNEPMSMEDIIINAFSQEVYESLEVVD